MSTESKQDVAVAVIQQENTVLLGKKVSRPGNFLDQAWHFPGGKVDVGETIREGLIRETKEETNLDIKSASFIGTTYTTKFRIHYFECIVEDINMLKACDDLEEVAFIEAKQIFQLCPPHVQGEWPEKLKTMLKAKIANYN